MVERYEMAGFALSFLCGVMAASLILPRIPVILVSFLLSLFVIFINRRSREQLKAALILAVFTAGMLNYSLSYTAGSKLAVFEEKPAEFECIIIGNPAEKGGYLQYTAKCKSVAYGGKHYNYTEKAFLRIDGETVYRFGDLVAVKGECTAISGIRNPGDFDYKLYYRSKEISSIITAQSTSLIRGDSAGSFAKLLHLSKEKVRNTIYKALPEAEAAMLVGIITGDRTDIDEDTRDAYVKTGLSHILSVSGLHVGFLLLLLNCALAPFRLDKRLQGGVIILIITYYVLLIGAPLPSVRALIMLGVLMLGKTVGRNYDLTASVSFALMLILIFKPLAIHDPGFMISFGAMYSIAMLYSPLNSMFRCIPAAIRNTTALSLAVWLGLAPVLAHYFNYISVISILINIAAVPLSLIITVTGFIGVFAGIVSDTLALYIFSVDYYLIRLLTYIIKKASELPAAGFYIPSLPAYFHVLYYIGLSLGLAVYKSHRIRAYFTKLALVYLLSAVALVSIYNLPSQSLKLVFFDVGQGDSSLTITPGKRAVLVDGGGSSGKGPYYYDVGGKITLPALLHQGIWKIDTVIVSHLHDDHMEGLLKVIEVYPVRNLILPRVSAGSDSISGNSGRLFELCSKKRIRIFRLGKGDYISLGKNIRIDFLHPGDKAMSDENENSLVSMLSYGNFRALLTGDISKSVEAELARGSIRANVLKVPHHGSGRSSSKEFLEKVNPRVSVVSVGKNNFGHPAEEALFRLKGSGSMVFRTDENGAVVITTDGKSIKVKAIR